MLAIMIDENIAVNASSNLSNSHLAT